MSEKNQKEIPSDTPLGATGKIPHVAVQTLRSQRTKYSYSPVGSIQRALLILKHLNELEVGQVWQLSQKTGINKATVVRTLETLMIEGYVTRDECLGGYCITSEVKTLSAGFSGRPRLIEASREGLLKLSSRVKWPVSIASINANKIIIDFSTNPISQWSYSCAVIGETIDITTSAMGRVALAFCNATQRERLINFAESALEIDKPTFVKMYIDPVVPKIKREGYVLSIPSEGHQFQTVAVPIMDNTRFIASLGIGFYKTAVQAEDVYEKFVLPMRETAEAIKRAWKSK